MVLCRWVEWRNDGLGMKSWGPSSWGMGILLTLLEVGGGVLLVGQAPLGDLRLDGSVLCIGFCVFG